MKNKDSYTLHADLRQRIDLITLNVSKPYFGNVVKRLAIDSSENASILCDYIISEQTEINIKQSTREGKIKVLVWLSNFHSNKPFKIMTKQNIIEYLNSLRKSMVQDPAQKWIGSYNGRQMILLKFFKWLYNSDEPDQRRRITPPCIVGIKRLPRKEKTPYKYSDMWEETDHATFLKYCPNTRDRCYHAMVNDASARPHELLNLKIKDIKFTLTEDGIQFAELFITEGKTGPRTVPLIDSIPYLKEWIAEHPSGTNPDSWLFISKANKSFGNRLTYEGLVYRYSYNYKKKYFPNLLKQNSIPERDKTFIRNMLTKPWNLYVFRHSALTDKSRDLSDSVLKDHAGWTMSSNMPRTYVHLRGDSTRILLQRKGIIMRRDSEKSKALSSKKCPNCYEPNKPNSKFCVKCKMILSYDAYTQTVNVQEEQNDALTTLSEQVLKLTAEVENLKREQQLTC